MQLCPSVLPWPLVQLSPSPPSSPLSSWWCQPISPLSCGSSSLAPRRSLRFRWRPRPRLPGRPSSPPSCACVSLEPPRLLHRQLHRQLLALSLPSVPQPGLSLPGLSLAMPCHPPGHLPVRRRRCRCLLRQQQPCRLSCRDHVTGGVTSAWPPSHRAGPHRPFLRPHRPRTARHHLLAWMRRRQSRRRRPHHRAAAAGGHRGDHACGASAVRPHHYPRQRQSRLPRPHPRLHQR